MLIERYEAAAGEFPGSPAAPLLRIRLNFVSQPQQPQPTDISGRL